MLRISKLTDYGTVVLACLAATPDRRLTATAVAERTRLGLPTVSKLLKSFHRAGLRVLGVDTDPAKPAALKPGVGRAPTPYLKHLGAALYDELAAMRGQAWLTGTDAYLFEAFGVRAQRVRVEASSAALDA
jgi:hypothetical protein